MLKLLKIFLTSLLFLYFAQDLYAQSSLVLNFKLVDQNGEEKIEKAGKIDSAFVDKVVAKRINQLNYQGYLSAFVEDYSIKNGQLICEIRKGQHFQLEQLTSGNIEKAILENTGLNWLYEDIDLVYLEKIFKKILDYSENHGYPFAIVKLDSIKFTSNGISASLNLFNGPKITYGQFELTGFNKIKRDWLESYLGINVGKMYSELEVKGIPDKLKELPFLQLAEPVEVVFNTSEAIIKLSIAEKKINNVDGVIGFLPNQREDSKVLITGSFNLHLYNLFSSAKQLHIDWQKVNVNSQTLNTSIYYPHLLKMPLGLSFEFDLLKEDTVYLNRYAYLKIDFNLRQKHKIYFTSLFESSGLLTENSNNFETLNNFEDYKINYFGIVYRINLLDDELLPQSGTYLRFDALAGTKKFKDRSNSSSIEQGEIRSTQFKLESRFDHYFNISQGYLIKIKLKSGNIVGRNIFKNDLFRLGGLRSIRGFNENFFFASDYVYTNLEFRIAQSSSTYFFTFYDQGILYNRATSEDIDFPFGTGIGLNLGTNAGLFSLVVGLGKSRSQIFSLNSAKIHFGYIGRF